jgi:hypothetical protein
MTSGRFGALPSTNAKDDLPGTFVCTRPYVKLQVGDSSQLASQTAKPLGNAEIDRIVYGS